MDTYTDSKGNKFWVINGDHIPIIENRVVIKRDPPKMPKADYSWTGVNSQLN